MLGMLERRDILASERAVAKTWSPRAWKAIAMTDPSEPLLQPVIKMEVIFLEDMVGRLRDDDVWEDGRVRVGHQLEIVLPGVSEFIYIPSQKF